LLGLGELSHVLRERLFGDDLHAAKVSAR